MHKDTRVACLRLEEGREVRREVRMVAFPTVGHLISGWASLCPRLDESAGRVRSTRVRAGAVWLKPLWA